MTLKDIRKRLIDLDLSASHLALELDISRQMVNEVLHGRLATPWIRRAIAERLGFTYRAMWGMDDPGTARGIRAPRRSFGDLHASSVAPISLAGEP